MNKKGFTLVELLAVVSILAILIIIALPNVMSLFNKSKKESFSTEIKQLYKVAENTWMSESLFGTSEKVYSRCDSGCTNELDMSGRKNLHYYIKVDKGGKIVEFYATDGNYQFGYDGHFDPKELDNVQDISSLDQDIISISNNVVLIDNNPPSLKKMCIVNSKSYSAEKEYYYYVKGSTISSWQNSEYNVVKYSLDGVVNTSNTYTQVTTSSTLVSSDEGCYYPVMKKVCIIPYLSTNYIDTKIDVPAGITKEAYVNGMFFNGTIPFNQFITKTGLFHPNPETLTNVQTTESGCYFSGTRTSLGNTVTVYLGGGSARTCYANQTIGECMEGHPTYGGKTVYYGKKYLTNNYGNMYSMPASEQVDPGESYYLSGGFICLDGETEVEVFDKKKKKKLKKKLKDVTYDDLILCWDFDKGEFAYQKPVWIMKEKKHNEVLVLTFSDGTVLRVSGGIGDHRIYNADKEMFTSAKNDKDTPIGMRTFNSNGEYVTLVKKEQIKEEITLCNVATYKDINIFANGILTSRGSNNLYKIHDMKFVKDDRETLNREDFEDIDNDTYYGFRLGERDVKSYGSREDAIRELYLFLEEVNSKKK